MFGPATKAPGRTFSSASFASLREISFALALLASGCRTVYPAPEPRTAAPLEATHFGRLDSGDAETIRRAENACLSGLSPRAVSAAFQAVDDVAEALVDLCSIGIVNDDPLVWHVWCGSDALFTSGHYLPPSGNTVQCEGASAGNAFECIGRILARHLLSRDMTSHVEGVEIVSIGSVDRQRVAAESEFLREPCSDLQRELGLGESARFAAAEGAPNDDERAGVWNQRLSWCRAAFSAREMQRGMAQSRVGASYELGAIGASTDWLDNWRRLRRTQCPTSEAVSGERGRGQCRDARRVDVFIRVDAREGGVPEEACRPPSNVPGGESGRALYCLSDCQARAAIGRNPQGYQAPRSPNDLLFGTSRAATPEGWLVDRAASGAAVNTTSIRQLLLREQ
jgi:hypothetical protein